MLMGMNSLEIIDKYLINFAKNVWQLGRLRGPERLVKFSTVRNGN